ncbi:MAG: peptidase M4 family protein [Bdellovibrionales bacterium]|nr:peptidase M4 family protein [Bdellovibrionales bacterium]
MQGKKITSLLYIVLACTVMSQAQAAEVVSLAQVKLKSLSTDAVYSLAADSTFSVIKSENLKDGSSYTKSQQMFKGVPVWGYQAVVSTDSFGSVMNRHGYVVSGISQDVQDVTAKLTSVEAIAFAKADFMKKNIRSSEWIFDNMNAVKVIFIDDSNVAKLAYRVSFLADTKTPGNPFRGEFYIDAKTAKILQARNILANHDATGPGGNLKTGKYHYGVDFPALDATANGNQCQLKSTNVATIDLKNEGSGNPNGDSGLNTTPHTFTCSENTDREINGAYSPLNDAHFFGTTVFNMYQTWYGVNPLKTSLTLRVHYAKEFENAFWDGKQMTFGDGKDLFYPLVVLDVTAHEVSHGFTEFNSGLEYANQSGGINEAFSDIAGEAAEYFARGKNDFLVGGEVAKNLEALRFMADPTKDGKSIDNVSKFVWTNDTICMLCTILRNEFCASVCTDVHHSSGIYNKAFHLIATSNGWDTKKAFDIFVLANQKFWTPKTTFADGAKGVMDAAGQLKYNQDDVKKAFAAVGINL